METQPPSTLQSIFSRQKIGKNLYSQSDLTFGNTLKHIANKKLLEKAKLKPLRATRFLNDKIFSSKWIHSNAIVCGTKDYQLLFWDVDRDVLFKQPVPQALIPNQEINQPPSLELVSSQPPSLIRTCSRNSTHSRQNCPPTHKVSPLTTTYTPSKTFHSINFKQKSVYTNYSISFFPERLARMTHSHVYCQSWRFFPHPQEYRQKSSTNQFDSGWGTESTSDSRILSNLNVSQSVEDQPSTIETKPISPIDFLHKSQYLSAEDSSVQDYKVLHKKTSRGVRCLDYHDNSLLFSSSNSIGIFDISKTKILGYGYSDRNRSIESKDWITGLAHFRDTLAISCSHQSTIRLWNYRKCFQSTHSSPHTMYPRASLYVKFDESRRKAVTTRKKPLGKQFAFSALINQPENHCFYTMSSDHLIVWDSHMLKPTQTIRISQFSVDQIEIEKFHSLDVDGPVAICGGVNTLFLCDSREKDHRIIDASYPIFSDDVFEAVPRIIRSVKLFGTTIAFGDESGLLDFWDIRTMKSFQQYEIGASPGDTWRLEDDRYFQLVSRHQRQVHPGIFTLSHQPWTFKWFIGGGPNVQGVVGNFGAVLS